MLLGWGYSKAEVKVDTDKQILSIADVNILKVSVKDYSLNLEWYDGSWEQWQELQTAPELATLKSTTQSKLDKAKAASSAANGKGKKGKGKAPA